MKILGMSAYARTGKDTLASAIIARYPNLGFRRYAFADNLKSHLAEFVKLRFGYDIFNLTDEQKKIVRPLLIAYGCAQREIDKDYWVKQVDIQISEGSDNVIITDFRFPSEAEYFTKKYGSDFHLIELHRDGIPTPPNEEQINQPFMKPYVSMRFELENLPSRFQYQAHCVAGEIFDKIFVE